MKILVLSFILYALKLSTGILSFEKHLRNTMFSVSELFVEGRKSTIDGRNDLLRKTHTPVSSSEDHFDRRREAACGKDLT